MPIEARFRFAHARVEVHVEGCIKCGTLWSHQWRPAKKMPVRIGAREAEVTLYICGDCLEKGGESLLL